jgi:hypothetical protein
MVSVFFVSFVLCWLCVIAFIMYGRYQVSGTIGSRSRIFAKDSVLKKLLQEFFLLFVLFYE